MSGGVSLWATISSKNNSDDDNSSSSSSSSSTTTTTTNASNKSNTSKSITNRRNSRSISSSSSRKPRLCSTSKNQKGACSGPSRGSQARLAAGRLLFAMAASRRLWCSQQQRGREAHQDAAIRRPRTTASDASRRRLTTPRQSLASFGLVHVSGCFALVLLVAASLLLVCGLGRVSASPIELSALKQQQQQQQSAADSKAALEAEINSILQQQEIGQEGAPNSKLLSEAIISRLMLGNLTDISGAQEAESAGGETSSAPLAAQDNDNPLEGLGENLAVSAHDAVRLRRILNYLQNYELASQQYPVLPVDQAATIKRASLKMGNYLRQQAQHQHAGQRQLNGYGRVNAFDFGLGKRPDSSAGAGNILRFGDSASAGGHMAAVSGSGLGKRPAAHRYDFGLGKRVASPAYPRYDFGLGKRAPSNRIRYDFGLGK